VVTKKTPVSFSADRDVVIADIARSPLGLPGPKGALAGIRPADLLAQVVGAMFARSHLKPSEVTRVLIGGGPAYEKLAQEACALIGVAVRPEAPRIPWGSAQSVVHAGVRATGRRDVVLVLGLTAETPSAAWLHSRPRGIRAEMVAADWKLDRPMLDAYARRSRQRASEVAAAGEFASEIVPAVRWTAESTSVITADETIGHCPDPSDARLFYEPDLARKYPGIGWCLNTGNVSESVSGAAAAILVQGEEASNLGLRPRARILGLAENPHVAGSTLCGPVEAARAVLARTGLRPDDLDHYEVGETYASIPLAWRREFDADPDRFNPRGGSIGLGHAGPADGLRSLATVISALEATGGRLGIQASDGHGSSGDALIVERIPRAVPALA